MTVTAPREHSAWGPWLAAVDAAAVRVRCGIGLRALAAGIGVPYSTVWNWDTRTRVPTGAGGARYCRVIAGLARHLEVPEGD